MKRLKHGLFVFPPNKTLIWRRHCSIGQSCYSMTSKQSIDWFLESSRAWSFSPERSLNRPEATRVCIRSTNQSNRSISVRLLFLFCSRVFVSRSYENRSTRRMNTANIEPNITPFKSLDVIGSLGKQEGQFTIFWGKNTLSCTCLHLLFRSTHDVRAQISATHVQSYSSNTSRWVVGTTDI